MIGALKVAILSIGAVAGCTWADSALAAGRHRHEVPNRLDVAFGLPKWMRVRGEDFPLTVAVKNIGTSPIAIVDFPTGACFGHYYVQLALERVDGRRRRKIDAVSPPCPMDDWSGFERKLMPGAVFNKTIDLRAYLAQPLRGLAPGTYEVKPRWTEEPPELGPAFRLEAYSTSVDRSTILVVKGAREIVLEKGKPLRLTPRLEMRLDGDGHKTAEPDGPPSPLILYVSFRQRGKPGWSAQEVHVQLAESRQFKAGGYGFELVDHHYGVSMRLKAFGLVPDKL